MKVNELRIGNLVDYCKVGAKAIDLFDLRCIIGGEDREGIYSPIPLTEEILLKCGFECFEFDNGNTNQYRFKSRLIVIRDNTFIDYGSGVRLYYLHQLQNLYFALTGEELIIEL